MVLFSFCDDIVNGSLDDLVSLYSGLGSLLLRLLDYRGDIFHILEEGHGQSLARKLLAAVHGPVSVLEVVVLDTAELLDVAVAAVVVCHKETLAGDNLSGTSASELHDCVLE